MLEPDGKDLKVSNRIQEVFDERLKIKDLLGLISNREKIWIGFAS